MADLVKVSYSIKRFDSSKDRDFQTALQIYNNSIPVDVKTSTNEIIYFVDNPRIQSNRTMFFWGLYIDSTVVGFVEAAYLKETKSVIIDYIVLKEEYHLNSIFYPFFGLILNYMSSEIIDYDFIITEVGTECITPDTELEYVFSRRMLALEDFKIINNKYIQPRLGIKNIESVKEFQLMVKSTRPINSMKKETYLSIVHDIYYNHYLQWYSKFEKDTISDYREHIEKLYDCIEKSMEKTEISLSDATDCKYYSTNNCYYRTSTGGFKVGTHSKNRPVLLMGIPIMVIIVFFISWIIVLMLDKLQIASNTIAPILATVTTICTSIFTIAFTKVKNG